MTDSGFPKLRVLALASRFYMDHLDHLSVLGQHCDLAIAFNTEREEETVAQAIKEGFSVTRIGSIGLPKMEQRLRRLINSWQPNIVYSLWDTNEELTLMARRVVGQTAIVVHKYSDPLTTILGNETPYPGQQPVVLEREALKASDGQIFVTNAMRIYLEQTHNLDFSRSSIIVPHGRPEETVSPPSKKLSVEDGRIHIALVGFAHPDPDHGRYYINIIRQLISYGFVVHSHFHEVVGVSIESYRALADELEDYHFHSTLPNREGTQLSDFISQYDLMGVFHELEATKHNESAVLEICMPSKAVCGWVNGGIPVVCPAQYLGTAEYIQEFGIGFIIERWEDLQAIAADKDAIDRATEACLQQRYRFTHEWNTRRIISFFEELLDKTSLIAVSGSKAESFNE